MGTYNASAYNDNHTLLKLILNIQDYLRRNPNVAIYHTVGFQGTVATTSIPKDKVYGPVGSTNTPTAGDLILYALDLGQGFFQVGGADDDNYTGEYIGQTLTGPKGDKGDPGPEGPEGPAGPAGADGMALYYTAGFQGTVATTSIPKDKVHGYTGTTREPAAGDVILYALDLGQGFFLISGFDTDNYIGAYIGQTIQGDKGDPGTAATIKVGTVTTGNPTDPAAVTNVGTSSAAVFDFTIPRGEKGDKGDPGTGYSEMTGLYFNITTASTVVYSAGLAVFTGRWQISTQDGNTQFVDGILNMPITAGAGIIIDASEDAKSLVIKLAPKTYTVTNTLTYCETNNTATSADEGTAYNATITADDGYNFTSGYMLAVTMGGSDITTDAATISTDTIAINIASVTGDIEIECIAVEKKLATPTISLASDGKTLTIAPVTDATSYNVYAGSALKTNITTTTLDLTTLDLTSATYTFKVRAKASGYAESEFSNGIVWTLFDVTSAFTNCTASNSDTTYPASAGYNNTVTAADGYTFDGGTYAISVAGTDKTSDFIALSSDKKTLTISVPSTGALGNIELTCSAAEESSGYTVTISNYYAGRSSSKYGNCCVKINALPTSYSDFAASSTYYGVLIDPSGTIANPYTVSGVTTLYIWGTTPVDKQTTAYKYNGTEYIITNDYTAPKQITITSNSSLVLGYYSDAQ